MDDAPPQEPSAERPERPAPGARRRPVDHPPDRPVADRLHSASLHLLRALRAEDEASGLSAPRLSALSVLVFRGPCRPSELARTEQVTPATVSRLLALLEADGLVRRVPDPADGRAHAVHATAAGRALLEEGRRRRIQALENELGRRSNEELEVLERAAVLVEELARALRRGSGA